MRLASSGCLRTESSSASTAAASSGRRRSTASRFECTCDTAASTLCSVRRASSIASTAGGSFRFVGARLLPQLLPGEQREGQPGLLGEKQLLGQQLLQGVQVALGTGEVCQAARQHGELPGAQVGLRREPAHRPRGLGHLPQGDEGPHAQLQVLERLGSLGARRLEQLQGALGVPIGQAQARHRAQGLGRLGEALEHRGMGSPQLVRRPGAGVQERGLNGRGLLELRLIEEAAHLLLHADGEEHVLDQGAHGEVLRVLLVELQREGLGLLRRQPDHVARGLCPGPEGGRVRDGDFGGQQGGQVVAVLVPQFLNAPLPTARVHHQQLAPGQVPVGALQGSGALLAELVRVPHGHGGRAQHVVDDALGGIHGQLLERLLLSRPCAGDEVGLAEAVLPLPRHLPGLQRHGLAVHLHHHGPREPIDDEQLPHDEGRQARSHHRERRHRNARPRQPAQGPEPQPRGDAPHHLELPLPAPPHQVLAERPDGHAHQPHGAGGDERLVLLGQRRQANERRPGAQHPTQPGRRLGHGEEGRLGEQRPERVPGGARGLALRARHEGGVHRQRIAPRQRAGERLVRQQRAQGRSPLDEPVGIGLLGDHPERSLL